MAIANAAPIGVLAFGCACFVSGIFIWGKDNDPPETTGKSVAYTQIMCGVTLFIVAALFILGSQPAGPNLSMWAAGIFGFFAYLWVVLGLIILNGGDLRPMSSFLIFTCVCTVTWMIHSFKLGLISFGVLFVFASLGTFLAWIGIRGWWAQGAKWAGACFFVLGFVGLYIALWEMMTGIAYTSMLAGKF